MENNLKLVCESLEDVEKVTGQLDTASLVPIKVVDGGVDKNVDNWKGVYNNTQGVLCTSVVPYYNLVRHKQYFDGFAQALNRLGIDFKMIIQQSGNKAFADVEFKDRNVKFDKLNEEFVTGIRLVNSYNKSTGLNISPRFTRLACTNGMIITRSEKTLSIKHTSKIVNEIEKFIETRLNAIIEKDDELKVWVSGAMEDSIEWNVACKIMGKLFAQVKHREGILKNLGISVIEVKDKKTKKKSITYVWDNDDEKKEKITRWDLYNAATRYLTHGEHITPLMETHYQKRAERLLITPLIKLPQEKGAL